MCGIFGVMSYLHTTDVDKEKFRSSALLMKHRGPDFYGQWGIPSKIELGHLRLSIIDLSPENNQPLISNCKNYVIVFNGEIYNYLELRDELLRDGYTFKTNGDTEVLLNSYIKWGKNCVNYFNGDWAFAIYDIKNNELFCSRDRFGVKPFNYAVVNGQFIFSSEIKSIINYFPELRIPNYNVIANYCRNSIGAQIKETWFKDVFRLMPSNNLLISNGQIYINQYWSYPTNVNKKISFQEAIDKYYEKFSNAVELRLRSDVPIATALSSGLDSSSIVATINRIGLNQTTYTAFFEPTKYKDDEKQIYKKLIDIDEASIVKKYSKEINLNSNFIQTDQNDFVKILKEKCWFLESGNSSPSIVPLSNIYKEASSKIKVMLEGQGADELLAGYVPNLIITLMLDEFRKGQIIKVYKVFTNFCHIYSLKYAIMLYFRLKSFKIFETFFNKLSGRESVFEQKLLKYKHIKDYPANKYRFDDSINKALVKSHSGGLVNLLHYGDAISLSSSVEARLPFLDINLVEFVFSLPGEYKISGGLGKVIHRKAFNSILPSYISNQKLKYGFNTPIANQFSGMDHEAVKILLSDKCKNRGLFNGSKLERFIFNQQKRSNNNYNFLLRILTVELWFRMFIDNENKIFSDDIKQT